MQAAGISECNDLNCSTSVWTVQILKGRKEKSERNRGCEGEWLVAC